MRKNITLSLILSLILSLVSWIGVFAVDEETIIGEHFEGGLTEHKTGLKTIQLVSLTDTVPLSSYSEFSNNAEALKSKEISVVVNGVNLDPDVKPYEINGRVLVPMRAIFEALSAEVIWDEATATATAKKSDSEVKIKENSTTAYVNGNSVKIDVPATITNGRFMVPVRFISESLGAYVGWIEESLTVTVDLTNKIFEPSHNLQNELRIVKATQSGDDGAGSIIENVFDNNYGSKWAVLYVSNDPNGAYGIFDLGTQKDIDSLYIAFAVGKKRIYTVDIYVSSDEINYTYIKSFSSSGITENLEQIVLGAKGRYIKVVGKGNSKNNWMTILEFAVTGK